jgi:hypothetical protein
MSISLIWINGFAGARQIDAVNTPYSIDSLAYIESSDKLWASYYDYDTTFISGIAIYDPRSLDRVAIISLPLQPWTRIIYDAANDTVWAYAGAPDNKLWKLSGRDQSLVSTFTVAGIQGICENKAGGIGVLLSGSVQFRNNAGTITRTDTIANVYDAIGKPDNTTLSSTIGSPAFFTWDSKRNIAWRGTPGTGITTLTSSDGSLGPYTVNTAAGYAQTVVYDKYRDALWVSRWDASKLEGVRVADGTAMESISGMAPQAIACGPQGVYAIEGGNYIDRYFF